MSRRKWSADDVLGRVSDVITSLLVAEGCAYKHAEAVDTCRQALQAGNKLMFCGNGGSAAQCQHAVGELVGAFKKRNRLGLAAIALCSDINVMTAIANDYGFKAVFARQVQALGKQGDVLICLSTSGNSMNCIEAVLAAHVQGVKTIAFTGQEGGRLAESVAVAVKVPSEDTPRIQEAHLVLLHLLCEELERFFFVEPEKVEENITLCSGHGGGNSSTVNEPWIDEGAVCDKYAERANKVLAFLTKHTEEVLGYHTGAKELRSKDKLADLGADSLDVAELVMALEDEFNVDLKDSSPFATVKEVVSMVVTAMETKK